MRSRVFVVDREGRPLAPMFWDKAMQMVRRGAAEVWRRKPFLVVRLRKEVPPGRIRNVCLLGVDPGTVNVGIALLKFDTNEVFYLANVRFPTKEVSEAIERRRERRRARRKGKGRGRRTVPRRPGLKGIHRALWDWYWSLLFTLIKVCALKKIIFDWQPVSKPRYPGFRKSSSCQLCGRKGELHQHHVVPASRGGKDTPENLITLCPKCHHDVHTGKLPSMFEVWSYRSRGKSIAELWKLTITLKSLISMWNLSGLPTIVLHHPKSTVAWRTRFGLPKDHALDAAWCLEAFRQRRSRFSTRTVFEIYRNRRHYRCNQYYLRPDRICVDRRTGRVVAWNRRPRHGQDVASKPSLEQLRKKYGEKVTGHLTVLKCGGRVGWRDARRYRLRRLDIVHHRTSRVTDVVRSIDTGGRRVKTFTGLADHAAFWARVVRKPWVLVNATMLDLGGSKYAGHRIGTH